MQVVDDALRVCPIAASDPESCQNSEMVEVERDGEHEYWECPECGYAWGYRPVEDGVRIDASCQMGIPESVRRANSPAEPVSLGSTIRVGPPS